MTARPVHFFEFSVKNVSYDQMVSKRISYGPGKRAHSESIVKFTEVNKRTCAEGLDKSVMPGIEVGRYTFEDAAD